MKLRFNNITLRNALPSDAALLAVWWNDGAVMAHAGFPNGLGISVEEAAGSIGDGLFIIEEAGKSIGEASCRPLDETTAEIGIKICVFEFQNRGLGKIALSLLIKNLFERGFEKIVLDTNLSNLRAQHVYESLGFKKLRVNVDSWKDQLGTLQSSVDYELTEKDFIDFIYEKYKN